MQAPGAGLDGIARLQGAAFDILEYHLCAIGDCPMGTGGAALRCASRFPAGAGDGKVAAWPVA
jgi:hypothetical protein